MSQFTGVLGSQLTQLGVIVLASDDPTPFNPPKIAAVPGDSSLGRFELGSTNVAGITGTAYWGRSTPPTAILGFNNDYAGYTIPGVSGSVGLGADVVFNILNHYSSLLGEPHMMPGSIMLGHQQQVAVGGSSVWNVLFVFAPYDSILGNPKTVYGELAFGAVPLVSMRAHTTWQVSTVRFRFTATWADPNANWGQLLYGRLPHSGRGVATHWNTQSNVSPTALYADSGAFYGNIEYAFYPAVGVGASVVFTNGVAQVIRATSWNVDAPTSVSARVSQTVLNIPARFVPAARVSQTALNVLSVGVPNAVVSQTALMVIIPTVKPSIRITEAFAQTAISRTAPIRATNVFAQAVFKRIPPVRLTETFVQAVFKRVPPVRLTQSFAQVMVKLPVGSVDISGQAIWNCDSNLDVTPVDITSQAIWNVRQLADAGPDATTWNDLFGATTTPVDVTDTTSWNDHSVRGQSRSTTWNVIGEGSKQIGTTWNDLSLLPRYDSVSLWLKADQGVTVDGLGNVQTWQNFSSPNYYGWDSTQNHDATQTSTFSRPEVVSNGLNGLPTISFNGSTQFLNINNSPGLAYYGNSYGCDIFVVMLDSRTDNVPRYIISEQSSTAIDTAWFFGTINTSPTGFLYTAYYGGNQDNLDASGNPSTTYQNEGRGNAEAGTWIQATGEMTPNNDASPTVYVNGADQGATFRQTGSMDWFQNYAVGRNGSNTSGYWNGQIAEIIVYGSTGEYDIFGRFVKETLTIDERTQVEDYLNKKWFNLVRVGPTGGQAIWNDDAATTVDVTGQAIWNDMHLPFQTATATWDVTAAPQTTVDVTRSPGWNDRAHVDMGPQGTSWNDLHRPTTDVTIGTTWNDLERPHVIVTASPTWNDRHRVDASTTGTTWNIRKVRDKFRTVYFNVHALVDKTRTTTWDYDIDVGISAGTTWNQRATAGKLMNPQPLNRTRWNVYRNSTSVVNQEIYSEWNDHHTVDAFDSTTWNERQVAHHTGTAVWDVTGDADQTRSTTWNVRHVVDLTATTNWLNFPNALYASPSWNVYTLVVMAPVETNWHLISYNNNTALPSWNVRAFVDATATALWNILPPPISVEAETEWGDRKRVKIGKTATTWNVIRNRGKSSTTYWDVITGIINCDTPIPSQSISEQRQVRYNVISAQSPKIMGTALWDVLKSIGHGSGSDGPLTRTADWRDLTRVDAVVGTDWDITLYTTDVTIGTTWLEVVHADKGIMTQWRDLNNVSGDPGLDARSTAWNVQSNPISNGSGGFTSNTGMGTAWNDYISADKAVQALWTTRAPTDTTSVTQWNDIANNNIAVATYWGDVGHADVTAPATWRDRILSALKGASPAWNVHVTVGTSIGTNWNDNVRAEAGTSWNNRQLTDKEDSVFWNDRELADKQAETTWAIGIGTKVGTTWSDNELAGQEESTTWNTIGSVNPVLSTTWNTKLKVNVPDGTTWNDKKIVGKGGSASWDYSTVSMSGGSLWNDKQAIHQKLPAGGTLWNVDPPCTSEYVAADPCVRGQGQCGGTALVPQITVCQMTRAKKVQTTGQGKYVKKYLQ